MKKKKILIVIIILLLAAIPIVFNKVKSKNTIQFVVEQEGKDYYLKLKVTKDYKIYYTTDGTIPNENSNQYTDKILINNNTSPNTLTDKENSKNIYGKEIFYDEDLPKAAVIRAITVSSSGTKSKVYTKTIFPNTDLKEYFAGATVISLVTDPKNLLDYDEGIFVKGYIYDQWLKENNKKISKSEELVSSEFVEGNFMEHGEDWERECNIEIFDGSNESVVNEKAGIRIKGNISRMYNQKSLNIYFRDKYDKEFINYPLWKSSTNEEGKIITVYKSITLRNGGNDTEQLKFKDEWLQELVSDRAVDIQKSKRTVLFINGEYWGVYSLQEKYSKDYYAEHYGLNKNNIIAIKEGEVDIGEDDDYQKYEELMSYAKKDLTDQKTYNEFISKIDLQSMIDYYAIQTYINNSDWGLDEQGVYKNVLLWRTRTIEDGTYGDTKWRWSLYDLEYSSSLYNEDKTSASYCAIEKALEKHPLFASAMKNQEFKEKFYNTYYELKESNFKLENIKTSLNNKFNLWDPLMSDHYKRFGNTNTQRYISKNSIIDFFENRIFSNPC